MVVRLHLERRHPTVADVDHAGVFSRPLDDPRPAGGKFLQMHAARLVGAVLRPHHRENPQLGVIRRATEDLFDALVFVGSKTMGGNYCRGDRGLGHEGIMTKKVRSSKFELRTKKGYVLS